MQTQRQQLNLFSSTPLSYDNMSKLKKCMEDHYHYNVDQIDMKVNKGEGRGSIIVIRGYSANFIEKFVPCLSTIKEETEQTVSELENELRDIISHINGQLDYSMNAEFNIENCSILRKHLKYTALKQTCFSIYTGKNDFTLSFKWMKNNKPEGRKTDIKLNNGDAYVLFMDHSDDYTIGESSSKSSTKKASTKKTTTKKEKNPLNDTKNYTSRSIPIKGKNGSKLRVAIHKETREVFKKVEENWTDEGHAKFTELFPDGKDVVKKKAKKPSAKKKEVKKTSKKPAAKKKEVKPAPEVKKQESVEKQDISEEVDSMPDELEDDLDMDDIQSVTSDTNNDELNDMEEMVLDGSDNEEQDKPNESDNENQSDNDDEDQDEEENVNVSDVNELQPDIYTEQYPTKDNDLLPTILNLKLHLYTVPETETLCDEYNRKEDRKVFLLFNKDINELSLGKEHRIGNRIYGIDTEYPIYNVLTM